MNKKVSLKAVKALFELERSSMLEEVREYSLEAIKRAYPYLSGKESKELYNLIVLYFSTEIVYF